MTVVIHSNLDSNEFYFYNIFVKHIVSGSQTPHISKDICFYIHYTLGVTFTDGHNFYSDSYSVIHSHHNLCLHIHYTFGVTFTDDYHFYSDSYSFIHRHFFVQLAICYTLYLDKSKSIITHSLHIRYTFVTHSLHIRYTFARLASVF